MFTDIPECGRCQSSMVNLPGFMTYYCPYCSSQEEAIAFIRETNTDPEIENFLKELENG